MARLIKKEEVGIKTVVELSVEGGMYQSANGMVHHNCDVCKSIHTIDGHTPKLWYLSEVGHGYHQKGETNPKVGGLHPNCYESSTKLHTLNGMISIKELFDNGKPIKVVVDNRVKNRRVGNNQFGKEIPGKVWYDRHASGARILDGSIVYNTGIQPCLQITLDTGLQIKVSNGHEMWVDDDKNGKKVRADELCIGNKIPLLSGEGGFGNDSFEDEAELMGFLIGDGSINQKSNCARWIFYGDKIEYGQRLKQKADIILNKPFSPLKEKMVETCNVPFIEFSSSYLGKHLVKNFELSKKPKQVPKRLWQADKKTIAAFLRGLYAADGHVEKNPAIVFSQSDLEFIQEIQLLLSNFGLRSWIFDANKKGDGNIICPNGEIKNFHTNKSWRLYIGGLKQVLYFKENIGLGLIRKNEDLNDFITSYCANTKLGAWRTAKVIKIESIGDQQTYCLTEPMTNTVTANGIVSGNCMTGSQKLLTKDGWVPFEKLYNDPNPISVIVDGRIKNEVDNQGRLIPTKVYFDPILNPVRFETSSPVINTGIQECLRIEFIGTKHYPVWTTLEVSMGHEMWVIDKQEKGKKIRADEMKVGDRVPSLFYDIVTKKQFIEDPYLIVNKIEPIGKQQTYCVEEPMTNTITVNGVVTGNCRCTLVTMMPGYTFDANGYVTYKEPGWSEIKHQRGEKQ